MKSTTLCLVLAAVLASSVGSPITIGIGGILTGVLDAIKGIVSDLLITLNLILTGLDRLVTNLFTISGLPEGTVIILKGLSAALKTAIQKVITDAGNLVDAIARNASSDVLLTLRNILKESVSAVKAIVAEFLFVLRQVGSGATNVIEIEAALNRLVAGLDAFVKTVYDKLAGALSVLDAAIARVVAILGQLVIRLGQALLTLINNAVAGVKADLRSVAGITEELLQPIFVLLDKIAPAAQTLLAAIKVALSNLTPDSIAAVTQAVGAVKTAIEATLSALRANPAFAAIIPTIEVQFTNIVTGIIGIVTPFVNQVKGLNLGVAINAALDNLLSVALSIRIN